MLLARPVLIALGACVAALGCRAQADRIARASQRAQPHLESYHQFERWAQRATDGASAKLGADALGEIVFAPIRNASDVSGAWVELAGDRALTLSLPASSPPPRDASWVALRDPAAGAVRVAEADPCPAARGAVPGAAAPTCVLISRGAHGAARRALTVTMAFASER